MDTCPDPAKNQSRRTFITSVTAALVAIPYVRALADAPEVSATTPASATPTPRLSSAPPSTALTHFPPLVFRSGSLQIESLTKLEEKEVSGGGGPRRFDYIQDTDECPAYGPIAGVNVLDGRGNNRYSRTGAGNWVISILLQKKDNSPRGFEDLSTLSPAQRTAQEVVVTRNDTGGSFKINIGETISTNGSTTKHRRPYKKYKKDRIANKEFRIGRVTVVEPSGATTLYPETLDDPRNEARHGFEVFVIFDHPPPRPGCPDPEAETHESIRRHKSFFEKLRDFFRGK